MKLTRWTENECIADAIIDSRLYRPGGGQVGLDVGAGEIGVIVENLLEGYSGFDPADDERDGDARPADNGFPTQDSWIIGDTGVDLSLVQHGWFLVSQHHFTIQPGPVRGVGSPVPDTVEGGERLFPVEVAPRSDRRKRLLECFVETSLPVEIIFGEEVRDLVSVLGRMDAD